MQIKLFVKNQARWSFVTLPKYYSNTEPQNLIENFLLMNVLKTPLPWTACLHGAFHCGLIVAFVFWVTFKSVAFLSVTQQIESHN